MRRARSIAAVLVVSLLGACGGSDGITGPTATSLAGTYSLTTANGVALPYILQAADPKVEVLSDQMTVRADGTWSEAGVFRFTEGTLVTTTAVSATGTFTVNGSVASFRDDVDGFVTTATVGTNTLTLVERGVAFIYSR